MAMARSASPGVVARIVHHPAVGKQGREEKRPRGIETEIQAHENDNVEFLKDGEVFLTQEEREGRAVVHPPRRYYGSYSAGSLLIFSLIDLLRPEWIFL
jgi:hypothetical protein